MKHKLFLLVISAFILTGVVSAQTNPYGDKYDDASFDAIKVIKVIDPAGFKPIKLTTDVDRFKTLILQLSNRAYTQLNIDTWYKCSYNHEQVFLLYNSYYKKIARTFFDENCKAICALMLLDGTLKSKE